MEQLYIGKLATVEQDYMCFPQVHSWLSIIGSVTWAAFHGLSWEKRLQGPPVQRIGLRWVPTQQLGLQKPQRMKDKLLTLNLLNLHD